MQLQKIAGFLILVGLLNSPTLTRSVAHAVAPEGFESFALREKTETDITIKYAFADPIWDIGYQSIQLFVTIPTKAQNFWTVGGMYQTTHDTGDRDAYFLRYDLVIAKTNSLSLKWMHDDYAKAKTGTDTIALEFNTLIGTPSGIYLNFGYYHKWFKHQWDKNWSLPFDINTDDERGFMTAQLGWKKMMSSKNFWTLDFNIRDPFGYHVVDLVGIDFTTNFISSTDKVFQILIGYRYSAVWVGTADIAEYHSSLGYSF